MGDLRVYPENWFGEIHRIWEDLGNSVKKSIFFSVIIWGAKGGLPCPDRSENLINRKSMKFYFDIDIQKNHKKIFYHGEILF